MPYKDIEKQRKALKDSSIRGKQRRKEIADQFKSRHGCKICGEKEPSVLDLHHTNPNNKLFTISQIVNKRKAIRILIEELEKCVCLCANCHRRLHAGLVELPEG